MSGIGCILSGGGILGAISAPNAAPHALAFNAPAVANFAILANGTYTSTGEAGGSWVNPTSLASSFDVRLTVLSGTAPAGSALNTWINAAAAPSWGRSVTNNNAQDVATCKLEIRETGSGLVRASSTITFTVESDTV